MEDTSYMPYEGAGFLLKFASQYVLGIRIRKPDDKDQTPEVEYIGGKVEAADNNNPAITARNELLEELGYDILDADWLNRVRVLRTFQPFSKKWIWCFELELSCNELFKLMRADHELRYGGWDPSEECDFRPLTGRTSVSRKALAGLVVASALDFHNIIREFSTTIPNSGNRMRDAKNTKLQLYTTHFNGTHQESYRIRAFNMVIFEEHMK
jgi:8-oxo-dGTP pyrophosphatase MutT (NUDIX family)